MNRELPDVQARTSRRSSWRTTWRSSCQHSLDQGESKAIPEKYLPVSLTMLKSVTVWVTKNWKILKEMIIPDHLTCLLRNMYVSQEATARTLYGTTDGFKIERGVCKGCLLSPCLLNLYTEHIMQYAQLDELQAVIKTARRNNNFNMQMIPF